MPANIEGYMCDLATGSAGIPRANGHVPRGMRRLEQAAIGTGAHRKIWGNPHMYRPWTTAYHPDCDVSEGNTMRSTCGLTRGRPPKGRNAHNGRLHTCQLWAGGGIAHGSLSPPSRGPETRGSSPRSCRSGSRPGARPLEPSANVINVQEL